MEYPGLWRYYRHLPQDLDSTALCSLLIDSHPWILLGRNIPQILANRDAEGRFMTWLLTENEPDVVARFRIEADPVVNANVIALLGDCSETRDAGKWLESLIREDKLHGASKWYPDTVTIYYSIARAMIRAAPVQTLKWGVFGQIGHASEAMTTAFCIEALERLVDAAPV